MEMFMGGAVVIEATLLSFLLALWITWMGLRGLFQLMPATRRDAVAIWVVPSKQARNRASHAA